MFIDAFVTKYVLSITWVKLLFLLSLHLWQISVCLFTPWKRQRGKGKGLAHEHRARERLRQSTSALQYFQFISQGSPSHHTCLDIFALAVWGAVGGQCQLPGPCGIPTQGTNRGLTRVWLDGEKHPLPPSSQPPGVLSEPCHLFLGELRSLKTFLQRS